MLSTGQFITAVLGAALALAATIIAVRYSYQITYFVMRYILTRQFSDCSLVNPAAYLDAGGPISSAYFSWVLLAVPSISWVWATACSS